MTKFVGKYKWEVFVSIICLIIISYSCYAALVSTESIYTQSPTATQTLRSYAKLRSTSALTTSYVDTDTVKLAPYSNITLLFELTKGGLTSFEYKVLQSYDGYNWFTEAAEAVTSTVITDYIIYYQRTFSGSSEKYFKTISFYANYVKLQVKGTGTASGSSCAVYVLASQN